LNSQI